MKVSYTVEFIVECSPCYQTSLVITGIVCSICFFVLGCVSGVLCLYTMARCRRMHTQQDVVQPPIPVYDDITMTSVSRLPETTEGDINFKQNVCYEPMIKFH